MKRSTLLLIIATVAFAAIRPAFSQTLPAATEGQLPFTIGTGVSNLNVDWGHNRMYGISIWAQWRPGMLPRLFDGFGLDIEGRDVNYGRPATLPSNFRMDTLAGGPIYTWHHFRNFQPYGKLLIGLGSIDFTGPNPYYKHDTRTIYAPGGGLQYRLVHHIWVRGDYEYQMWPQLFSDNRTLDPQGFTVGVSYDFRSLRHFE
ncbi:MAG TPA: outer membrane beta-barrel protein [Terracidiphilus sp.]|nr:outer membrane beta-barrel protein [Terracidiphilus sp.]